MVLAEDECRVEYESGIQGIWHQKGKYPSIKVEQIRKAVSYYGALNLKTGKCHLRDTDWQNSKETVLFLTSLEKRYKGKKVLLIWDGAPSHRGEVKKYLSIPDKKWQLEIEYFPPYSPHLNPQEKVWKKARSKTTHNSELSFEEKTYAFFKYVKSNKFKSNFLKKYA